MAKPHRLSGPALSLGFLLLCAGFADRLLAQGETTSAIVGIVSDASRAAVAGAAVSITNADNGAKRSAMTDDGGRFSFPQLKPGPYMGESRGEGL